MLATKKKKKIDWNPLTGFHILEMALKVAWCNGMFKVMTLFSISLLNNGEVPRGKKKKKNEYNISDHESLQ